MSDAHRTYAWLRIAKNTLVRWSRNKWFDWQYRVSTCGRAPTIDAITGASGVIYLPTHAEILRLMLELPGKHGFDYARYTFIDIGSGMGRVLVMASEYPYQRILGVEYCPERHLISQRNIRKFRSSRQKCYYIESMLCEASVFKFPITPIVLYMFNPFGREVMSKVVENLKMSLSEHRRSLLIIYHGAMQAEVVETINGISQIEKTPFYNFYSVG
jgi:predicted RNA methylase